MGEPTKTHTLEKLHVINDDGSRRMVHPADVRGRFTRIKPWVYGLLMIVYAGVPWVQVGGHPAVFFDIPRRHAFLFGEVYNAQDFYLVFSLLTGVGFLLIVASTLYGRVWCGWGCPQTVFLEGVFRPIERFIDGPAPRRRERDQAPWTAHKLARRALKHGAYLLVAWTIAHLFLAYFISTEGLLQSLVEGPRAHPVAFMWGIVPTAILYFNFSWFREQLCLIVCPYGRLLSALQDKDTINIGYDARRGEPRGKVKDQGAGDCVDCGRCVAVCPTDIDIRNGLQMECIGCAACVDACDEIMVRLGRPEGLIRYDSKRGLTEGVRRFWRPRVAYYAVAGAIGLAVAIALISGRSSLEANVLRPSGAPYVVTDGVLVNQVFLHVVNKSPAPATLTLWAEPQPEVTVMIPQSSVTLAPLRDHQLPLLLSLPSGRFAPGMETRLTVRDEDSGAEREVTVRILGPRAAPGGAP